MKSPAVCPVCGEDVPPRAKACPECGADERSGWKEDAHLYDGLDLPDEAWEEEDADGLRTKGGSHSPDHLPFIWQLGGGLALAGMLWWILRAIL